MLLKILLVYDYVLKTCNKAVVKRRFCLSTKMTTISPKTIFILRYTEYDFNGVSVELCYLNFVHTHVDMFTVFQHMSQSHLNAALVYLSAPIKGNRVLDVLRSIATDLKLHQHLPNVYKVKSNQLQALVEESANKLQAFV